MLHKREDGSGFIISPYIDEIIRTNVSYRRRAYFKNGLLKVERHSIINNLFVLEYKDMYITSWFDYETKIKAHDLISAVCNALNNV